jgi:hypothetical protein
MEFTGIVCSIVHTVLSDPEGMGSVGGMVDGSGDTGADGAADVSRVGGEGV